jgi:hypothetical protein
LALVIERALTNRDSRHRAQIRFGLTSVSSARPYVNEEGMRAMQM